MRNILDETDKKIVSTISSNARISAKNLAEKLNIHHNTVIHRLKRLEERGVISGYSTCFDYGLLGYDLQVVIMIKIKGARPGDASQLKDVLTMDGLEAIYSTTGVWDVISFWRVKDKDHLNNVIREIVANPFITRTISQIVLHTYKNPYQFNPFPIQKQIK